MESYRQQYDIFAVKWLINISEIEPYTSAVIGNNFAAFYTIHSVAIFLISISLISCLVVIYSILCRSRKQSWDFADRFPFYLAIADGLWGISHLADHLVVITNLKYPDASVGLSINLWFFLGYQQLMHAGLAIFTYLKIVHSVSMDLGKVEWKLHSLILTTITLTVAIFYPLGAFGCAGYWFLQDVQTTAGLAFGCLIAITASIHALCTTIGYLSIKKVVEDQRLSMISHYSGRSTPTMNRHSTATECLTTFVRIALALYCPLGVFFWICFIESIFGVFEPFTPFLIVLVANSSGWANALGYFYNNRVKARRTKTSEYVFSVPSNSASHIMLNYKREIYVREKT